MSFNQGRSQGNMNHNNCNSQSNLYTTPTHNNMAGQPSPYGYQMGMPMGFMGGQMPLMGGTMMPSPQQQRSNSVAPDPRINPNYGVNPMMPPNMQFYGVNPMFWHPSMNMNHGVQPRAPLSQLEQISMKTEKVFD